MKITNCGRGIHQREIPGLEKLKELPNNWHAFTNLDMALPGRGAREIDVVMIIEDRILLIDLKDWIGPVVSKDGNWFNGKNDCGRSPVHKISENVRELVPLLKKFLADQEKKQQGVKLTVPKVEGVVVLTRTPSRAGISDSEISRVFSIDYFIRMLKNSTEKENLLGFAVTKNSDFTSLEWIARFRQFFNTSTGIFQAGVRRYGGFRAKNENPTFAHRDGIFAEFDVDEEGVDMSSGLLRRWDFTKAETRFQSEEGRASIVGREKSVIAWLDDRNSNCGSRLLKPKIDDQDKGVSYWEVFERRRRMKRLSEFCSSDFNKTTPNERIELARQILVSAKEMHDLQAAHLDIGTHSVWLELPTTVKFSHLMAASIPEIQSLGSSRFQFLSSSQVPEDVIGGEANPLRKDVFLLGCAVHSLLFGKAPAGSPPEWDMQIDSDGVFATLHPWFERCLDIDFRQRYSSGAEMLDAFNSAQSSAKDAKSTINGLEKFRSLKSQRQVFQAYQETELLHEDERVVIWKTDTSDGQKIVKLWKGTAFGDLDKEGSRILAFLERADALIESPIPGVVIMRKAHWTGDAIVLVQDFVQGATLTDELIAQKNLINTEAVLQFCRNLVDVVCMLHERSVAHGDLKPDNIILSTTPETSTVAPILIDVLDFVPMQDGERLSRAYSPPSGSQFERDRFAVTKMVEEILSVYELDLEALAQIERAITQCRFSSPENATLLPLKEALERAAQPAMQRDIEEILNVTLMSSSAGPIFSDEGGYGISRSGADVSIRGAAEKLEIRLDSNGTPLRGRRVKLSQIEVQRTKRSEFAIFTGQIIIDCGVNDLSSIEKLLERPDFVEAWETRTEKFKPESLDDNELELMSNEALEDEIAERLHNSSKATSLVNVPHLWRRMVDLEAELTTESVCLGDSSFRRAVKRHVVPIQMMAGELDFDRNDTVTVERQDNKGRWTKIGFLDALLSSPEFIAIDSWIGSDRTLVSDGNRLRFQSRYENTSRERREVATSRILQRAAAAPMIIDVFQPREGNTPRRISCHINDSEVSERYGLNSVQVEAFKNILECRPVGLLQGPPGTGKTRFIGALVHYVLTHGLARNVLVASQSHEAVNNAAEAVLNLFGDDRDSLSLIRVGHEGSVSEPLRPHHVACVEKAYKDKFLATAKMRLNLVAKSIGIDQEIADQVIYFEDAIRPVLARITELSQDVDADEGRLNSLKVTVEQLLLSNGFEIELPEFDPLTFEAEITVSFMSNFPGSQAAKIEKLRQIVELSRDIVGSVSTWQRSFETFLAGTRQVVAGTCVGLGRTALGLTNTVFDLVIVDEAARCTSSELAVPIQAGKWVVLVGDQAQLEPLHRPEVVQAVSDELKIPLYEVVRSDFERVFESPYGKLAGSTLTKQYRMLPPIGRVVSSSFYDRGLVHGRTKVFLDASILPPDLSKPLIWVNTDSLGFSAFQKQDKVRRGSLINAVEADVIVTLLKHWSANEAFVTWLATQPSQSQTIGVICAYAAQRDLVWKKIQAENLHETVRRSLKVDTIDSYQGKENLIVLLSLVRNNADGQMQSGIATIAPGFMARKNRVNVALSRAMDRLVIIGAKSRWPAGSPLAKVAESVEEEIKSDEASMIDAKQFLDAMPKADRPIKKAEIHYPANAGQEDVK